MHHFKTICGGLTRISCIACVLSISNVDYYFMHTYVLYVHMYMYPKLWQRQRYQQDHL